MDKEVLSNYVTSGFSISQIAEREDKSRTAVRYWLKKYGLKTTRVVKPRLEYECAICGEQDRNQFYGSQKSRCKECCKIQQRRYQRGRKLKIIEYMGGKCVRCGYEGHPAAYDIHHLDPTQKDGDYYHMRAWSNERILKELENCILLCAICHRIEHAEPEYDYRQDVLFLDSEKEQNKCVDCGDVISKTAARCIACEGSRRKMTGNYTKIEWPHVDEILRLLESLPFVKVGELLGVSDNAVRKHLRKHGINPKTRQPL